MDQLLTVFRTEKKYEIPVEIEYALAGRLRAIMQEDEHNGLDGYMVRSLYFDSIYDKDYFDKVDGLEYRKKLRLRIYSTDNPVVKLEIKEKRGTAQLKSSLIISKELAEQLIAGNCEPLLNLKDPVAKRTYLLMKENLYRPSCIVEYQRKAFVHFANDTRITVDKNIRTSMNFKDFFNQSLAFQPVFTDPVLEVKYNGFLFSYLRSAVNLANLTEQSVSKYELSRKALHDR